MRLRLFLCQMRTSCINEIMNATLEANPKSASALSSQAISRQRVHGLKVAEKLPSGC